MRYRVAAASPVMVAAKIKRPRWRLDEGRVSFLRRQSRSGVGNGKRGGCVCTTYVVERPRYWPPRFPLIGCAILGRSMGDIVWTWDGPNGWKWKRREARRAVYSLGGVETGWFFFVARLRRMCLSCVLIYPVVGNGEGHVPLSTREVEHGRTEQCQSAEISPCVCTARWDDNDAGRASGQERGGDGWMRAVL